MSDKDQHMPSYSSSDIEKYLSGELSDPEMHALERAALDDPFLADALEGMASHRSMPGVPAFQEDMTSLQKRLESRVSSGDTAVIRRLIPLTVKYAAAVILVAGLVGVAYYTMSDKKMKQQPLAKTEVRPDSTAVAVNPAQEKVSAAAPAQEPAGKIAAPADSTMIKALQDETFARVTRKLAKKGADTESNYSYTPTEPAAKPTATLSGESRMRMDTLTSTASSNLTKLDIPVNPRPGRMPDSLRFNRDTTLDYALRDRVAGVEVTHSYKKAADPLVFTGKVINTQNTPLCGASISIKGSQALNVTTDRNGYFTLRLPKKDTVQAVVVNYVGYEQGFMALNTDNRTGNIIQLQPQASSLNEVVVEGFGSKRKEFTQSDINSVPKPLSQLAVPAEGWLSYEKYLTSNKRSPELDSLIRGYESVSFIVHKTGELSSFRIEHSLSPAHDSLTIRLIKEGPGWKLIKGNNERARVILTF